MPAVTVVIPLYNKRSYVGRALDSVLQQSFRNFEVIVVDDGSTDNGAEVVESYADPRIRLIRQENRGVSVARNNGVDRATADFITFLDADDEWMPGQLETISGLREKFPDAGLYATAYEICTPDGKKRSAHYYNVPEPPWEGILADYFKTAARGDTPVSTSAVGIPKKIFQELGGFPPGYWFGEDADLYGRIALKYPVAFSWHICSIYYQTTDSASKKLFSSNDQMPFIKTAQEAIKNAQVHPGIVESLNEYLFRVKIGQARKNILAGNSRAAKNILAECETKWNSTLKTKLLLLSMLPHPLIRLLYKLKII
ncbi:MAG TPA: glycosyltransferase [Methanocella sp.]|jgi:glycosyltransferase involved in cell wall biosynthesis